MRLISCIKFTLVIALFPLLSFAEGQPTFERLTTNDGLSHNTIRDLLKDKTGFLWCATLNGLDRFDGLKFKSFKPEAGNTSSLSSGKLKELNLDSKGNIWIRTYADLYHCYDPRKGKFVPIFENKVLRNTKFNLFYEDSQHNIWLGSTTAGCVKISFGEDKIDTKIYSTNQQINRIPSEKVYDILEDKNHNVWLLTSKGIVMTINGQVVNTIFSGKQALPFFKAYELNNKVYFISQRGKVVAYDLTNRRFGKMAELASCEIIKTAVLSPTQLLLLTRSQGIFIYNSYTAQFSPGETIFGEKILGLSNVQKDRFGDLWIYNRTGNVWMYNPQNRKVVKLTLLPSTMLQLIDEERYQFLGDRHGNVWITTYGNGLYCYNRSDGTLGHYVSEPNNPYSLSSNYLLSIALDDFNNIWIGTEYMGLNKISFSYRNVQTIYPAPLNSGRNGNTIKAFLEDNNRNIWVATKSGSLYQYDPTLSTRKTVFENGSNIYGMYQDKEGTIWMASKGNGLYELKGKSFADAINYRKTDSPASLSNNQVYSMLKDRKGRLWVATFGGGICVKTSPSGINEFRTFFNDDDWLKNIRYLMMDHKGDIWAGTSNGVFRFNPDALLKNHNAYRHYTFDIEDKTSLSNPEIRYIFEDSKGGIWLATAGGGLNQFMGENPKGQGIFKVFSTRQGMANDNIMAIQQDKSGCLWISTESGLHKFNPKTNLFQNYNFSNDFSANIFSEAAVLTCRNGRMLWGSLNGFYAFLPNKLNESYRGKNRVVLTGLLIFDEDAKIEDKGAPLKQSITFADKIVLKAADKVFHIEFANLNFKNPKANQYMYMLENYEKRWNVSGSYNVATYRNVPPGKYTFMVKSANSEGVWDDNVTTIEVVIQPPFWRSTIAILLYIIVLGAAGYFAYGLIMKFHRLNNAVKLERQLTDYKLRFFTNISHEFRTPLTLIRGSVDTLNELKAKMNDPMRHLVDGLDKNTTHLMRLIDQLLEFRKLQNNKQKLNLQKVEAVSFLKEIFTSFSDVAAKMNIEYEFLPSALVIPIYLDKNKVDKIVFNLLSNAFKFTPRGGKITLIAEEDDTAHLLRISVTDNGIGIPKEKQELLFSRFMQINFSASGTGIGLSLVNEFTTLHKGNVSFAENEGGGSIFTVEFPLNNRVYDKDDFVTEQIVVSKDDKKEVMNLSEFIENGNETLLNLLPNAPSADTKYKVLVIDDNDDIRDFLTGKLSPYFEVITAEDGNVGIKRSMEDDPDLIICDVMMPGMNGFELTKKLKDNFATCHIPVILLTAYIADEHNSEGIEAGADAYITKPFSMNHLMLQINKLLEKRERLRKHYASNAPVSEAEPDTFNQIPDRDSQFLALVEEIMEKNLDNPDFSVDEFAQMTNTGRTLFFKKVKYLTGYSPNEFVRNRRMKKAAELLMTQKYNVSEVSYMVGINDPFYFSKCFKAQYGCSPSRFPEDYKKES
jgi:Signal transduction histidine kinase